MATRRKTSRRKTHRRRKSSSAVVVMGKSRRRRSRRVSGAVGSTHRKRRRRIGSTTGSLKQIAWMAVGVAGGALGTHIILRPIEKHVSEKWPAIGKYIGAAEIFLGGMIALKGKGEFMKAVGVGVLAGGVHGLMKQFNISKEIPGIHGTDDYSTIRIPMGDTDVTSMVAGILQNTSRRARTSMVAGNVDRTAMVAGDASYDMSNLQNPYIPLGFEL